MLNNTGEKQKEPKELINTTTTDNKDKLIKIIKALLHTDEDLIFLIQLKKEDLEKLASIIRARTDMTDK